MNRQAEAVRQYDDEDYHAEKMKEGEEYQDYLTDRFASRGLCPGTYASKRYQYGKGENRLGMEIKLDRKYHTTGQLYIETHEKGHPSRPDYVRSGIYRNDNSWLFAIGDERATWVFSIKLLRALDRAKVRKGDIEIGRYQHKQTATSQGFVVPLADADKYCDKRFDWTMGDGEAEF